MAETNYFSNNPVCRILGIRFPICQAGMYSVAYGKLAAAVSNAGGLGVIGSAFMTAKELRKEIRLVKNATDKPFGVDILFTEVKNNDANSTHFTREVEDHIQVTFDERVPVLISGLGNPSRVVDRAHAAGMIVMSLVGTSQQALKLEASGVDIIIASGNEGGGHVGRVGTLPLVSKVVDLVKVPVLAAGGLADGRSLVAALALGAHGVWMGTRFIASEEARSHKNYKQKIVEIDEDGTVISRANSGKTARIIRNAFTEFWSSREEQIKPFPTQLQEVGLNASFLGRIKGDTENGALAAGQSAGLIKEVKPAKQIILDIIQEANEVLSRISNN